MERVGEVPDWVDRHLFGGDPLDECRLPGNATICGDYFNFVS